MKLTEPQKRALAKMTHEWQCAYSLKESLNTLQALKRKGAVEHKRDILGAMFSPTTANHYRLPAIDQAQAPKPDLQAGKNRGQCNRTVFIL